MKQPYLESGKIVTTHGVNGGLKIESYCDSPKVLASLPRLFLLDKTGNYTERKIQKASSSGGRALVYLEGVESLDDAILLKGKTVYAKREDLPLKEGAYFIADLIGLPLIDADTGSVYGKITEVEDLPSSQMYTVKTPDGKEVLFPAVQEFLVRVDIDEGVFVRPIAGFFEDEPT